MPAPLGTASQLGTIKSGGGPDSACAATVRSAYDTVRYDSGNTPLRAGHKGIFTTFSSLSRGSALAILVFAPDTARKPHARLLLADPCES